MIIYFRFDSVFKCPTRVEKSVKRPERDVEFEFGNTDLPAEIDNADKGLHV